MMSNLLAKTIVGFVALMSILAVLLFVSAGSLSFWQAWMYLAIFAGCTVLITAYLFKYDQKLLARRVDAGPAAETQRSQQLISGLASLCFIGMFVVAGLDARFRWSDVPPLVSVIGAGLVALGFYLVFLVFRENSYTSGTIEVAEEQRVIASGPYSLIRHPMYAGAAVLLIGSPLALGSWAALPLALGVILVVAVRSLDEERFLRANLRGYTEYCQKVRYRLIPFVW